MALKLLLADPDESWLESAYSYFADELGYDVKIVKNGLQAQKELYNESYFAIFLNLNLKNHSAIQVLKYIRTKGCAQKVIVINDIDESQETSSEEEPVDKEKLIKIGATCVVDAPFELGDLRTVLEGQLSFKELINSTPKSEKNKEEQDVNRSDNEFVSIKINEFFSAKSVLFDLYIKLGSGRYIKILHAGDKFDKDRIKHYRDKKNVEYLYFDKKDQYKYVKLNNHLAQNAFKNDQISSKTKLSLMKNITQKYLTLAFEEGFRPQIVDQAKEVASNVYELIENDKNLYQIFRSYADFDPDAFSHAYLVTLFSTSIIKQFEWQSRTTIESVAFACMFHDVGKLKLPIELKGLKEAQMNTEQLEEYKKHPEYGVEMIDNNSLIHNCVKQIILQHHEHFDGSGFPAEIRGSRILMLSNIVCIADDFAHIIQDEGLMPLEALKDLLKRETQLKRYNSKIVECLIKIFANPDKIVKESNLPSNSRVVNKKVS